MNFFTRLASHLRRRDVPNQTLFESITKARMDFEIASGKQAQDLYVSRAIFNTLIDPNATTSRCFWVPPGQKNLEFSGMKIWVVDSEIPIRVR